MKKTVKLLSLAGTLLLGLCMSVSAAPGDGKKKKGGLGGKKSPPEVIEKYDTDGDGKLSEEERKAAREARRAKILEEFDTDGDGKLSGEEKKAAREAMRARHGQRKQAKGEKEEKAQ